jgi:predicted MFS family arabinose efflux permease
MHSQRQRAFSTVTGILTLFLFGASVPTPLYEVYARLFGFADVTLTAIFAVYALGLLSALLLAGSVSDHAGRRPVIAVALGVQAISVAIFLVAGGTGALFAARVVQGIATGIATGALSAALIDLQPEGSSLGALAASVAPTAGLAIGAVASAALVQLAPAPLRLVYWVELALLAVAAGLLWSVVPETVTPDGRWRAALRVRVAVPEAARSTFRGLVPGMIATWALAGLFLSLGPEFAVVLLHSGSEIVGGLVPASLCVATGVSAILTRAWPGRRAVVAGTTVLAAGVAVTLIGIRSGSAVALFTGGVVSGLGFGPAFSGTFRTLAPLAPPRARAGMLAAVYVLSYLAFSVPAIIAGLAITHWGLRTTATGYAIAVIVLALAAAAATARGPQPPGIAAPAEP